MQFNARGSSGAAGRGGRRKSRAAVRQAGRQV